MQEIIGLLVLLIVIIISALGAWELGKDNEGLIPRITKTLLAFVGLTIVLYVGIAGLCGIAWIVAWIGIVIRNILQWIIEAILSPFSWFF